MKLELMLEDVIRGRMTKNGILIDLPFFVMADAIRQVFVPDEEHSIEDILPYGKFGRRVHWKISGDRWDALVKAHLAPTWYGKFTCDLYELKAYDFIDKNGDPQTTLVGQLRPITSEDGVAFGTTMQMEIVDEMNESGNDGVDCPQEASAKRFEALLRQTGRRGIENVLAELGALGFFSASASADYWWGLLEHSLNVYDEAILVRDAQLGLKPDIAARLPSDSIAIVALLHDVCKAEVYKVTEKFRKDQYGQWEKYNAYGVDYADFPLGHGEKTVIRLPRWGLEMTDDEIIAIRWHMSGFDLAFQSPEIRNNYNEASTKCPLLAILRAADGLASHIMEG